MKKQFLLLAGSAFLLLSCGSSYKQSNAQIIIDSTVNARVAARDIENARKNDSIINAEAKLKAEAMQTELEQTNKNKPANSAPATATQQPKTDTGKHQ